MTLTLVISSKTTKKYYTLSIYSVFQINEKRFRINGNLDLEIERKVFHDLGKNSMHTYH
jgi:hypothetical protein